MAFKVADRVKETTVTTGTGTVTLAGAASGFQVFSVIGDGNTTHYTILDANGTGWEVGIGTYTLSGTTLARTTVLASSNSGSAITLSTGTHTVFCGFPATVSGQLMTATNLVTGTDAAVTTAANATYVVDMSGWATANRNYTMPASPAVGDRVSIIVQSGNATYALIVIGNTSQTINGGSAATEWTRLFITGEVVTLRYVASNTWIVEYDGRIAMNGSMHLSTSAVGETAATYTYPTAISGTWTVDKNVGSICTAASDKITARRACTAIISLGAFPVSAIGDGSNYSAVLEVNGGASLYPINLTVAPGMSAQDGFGTSRSYVFALNDYVRYQIYSSQGSRGALGSGSGYVSMSFTEIK